MYYYFIWRIYSYLCFKGHYFYDFVPSFLNYICYSPKLLALKNNWDRIKSHLKSCASDRNITEFEKFSIGLKNLSIIHCEWFGDMPDATVHAMGTAIWHRKDLYSYTFLLQHKLHFGSFTCVGPVPCVRDAKSFLQPLCRWEPTHYDGSIHARRYRNSLLLHLPPHSPLVLTVPKFPSMKENKSQTYRRFWLFTLALCWFYFLACFVVVNGNVRLGKKAGAVLSKTVEIIVTLRYC